jgi:hypothetical protein
MLGFKKLTMEVRNMSKLEKIRDNLIEKSTDEKLVKALVTGSIQDPETGEPLFDCYYEEETGYLSDKLTVSSEGFRVITDVLEDLFEQFGFVRFPDKNNLEAVTELDAKLEYAFTEIRIDLIEAFDKAVKRLGEESK